MSFQFKKIPLLGKIARWVTVGFLSLFTLALLITGDIVATILMALLVFLISPYSNKYLFSRFKQKIPSLGKVAIGIVLFITSLNFVTPTEPHQVQEPDAQAIAGELKQADDIKEPETAFYKIESITDGDTIKVVIDDKVETVRLANVDTPETVDPRRPVECFGKEASEQMSRLISGKQVALEPDDTQSEQDQYDRLIRFVFLEDGTDVGLEMIKLGFAQSSPYGNSPHKYLEEYKTAQENARNEKLGLWNPNTCPAPTPTPTPIVTPKSDPSPVPVQSSQPTSNNSQPTTVAPPTNPSTTCPKNCTEAREMGMTNMTRDHQCYASKLDRDNDGIACDK